MELILIRHGATVGNLARRFLGVTDEPLSPAGAARAKAAAARLPAVERVYRSPLRRCAQTAALLWPDAPVVVVDELRETDFGVFEGRTHEELQNDPRYRRWLAVGGAPPGGESPEQAAKRAAAGLARVLADANGLARAGVVTHGGTIMALLARYGAPARPGLYDWACGNCGGYRLLVHPAPLSLEVRETL